MVLCLAWLIYGETNDWNPRTLTVCITRLARLVAVRLKEFWSDFGTGTEIKPRKLRVNLLRMLDSSLHSSFTTRGFKLCEWSPFPTSPVPTVLNCGTCVIIRKSIVAARRVNKARLKHIWFIQVHIVQNGLIGKLQVGLISLIHPHYDLLELVTTIERYSIICSRWLLFLKTNWFIYLIE